MEKKMVPAELSILSQPLKDIYEAVKKKFGTEKLKFENKQNIKELITKVKAYEKVKTIWQRDKEVSLSSFYYPSRVILQKKTKKISSLNDLPQRDGIVIEGTVGQGKSIFLRYLCIQELKNKISSRIPVLVELRKIDTETSLEMLVYKAIENLGFTINDELFKCYADTGKIVLLLDGFDELNDKQILPVISELECWAERYPDFQVIVSSRPGGEIQKSRHFSVIKLAPLSSQDHRPFLSKIGVENEELEKLLQAVNASPSQVKEFLNTPLLLTLLAMVYKTEGSIPAELPDFFEDLFRTVITKHDKSKPGFERPRKTSLNDRSIELLFESFCFSVMKLNYGVSLGEEQYVKAFDEARKYRNEKCDQTEFRHDLVKIACLLLEDGNKLAFAHKSLLEYFCAAFLKHATEKQAEKIYSAIQDQPWWQSILQYTEIIDKYKYYKYYAIPKIKMSFEQLGINPDVLTSQEEKKVLNFFIKECTIQMEYQEESNKYKTTMISQHRRGSTIYLDKISLKILTSYTSEIFSEFARDEILEKINNKNIKSMLDNKKKIIILPMLRMCTKNLKTEILKVIKSKLESLSEYYRNAIDYVKSEDEKASDLSNFEVN